MGGLFTEGKVNPHPYQIPQKHGKSVQRGIPKGGLRRQPVKNDSGGIQGHKIDGYNDGIQEEYHRQPPHNASFKADE